MVERSKKRRKKKATTTTTTYEQVQFSSRSDLHALESPVALYPVSEKLFPLIQFRFCLLLCWSLPGNQPMAFCVQVVFQHCRCTFFEQILLSHWLQKVVTYRKKQKKSDKGTYPWFLYDIPVKGSNFPWLRVSVNKNETSERNEEIGDGTDVGSGAHQVEMMRETAASQLNGAEDTTRRSRTRKVKHRNRNVAKNSGLVRKKKRKKSRFTFLISCSLNLTSVLGFSGLSCFLTCIDLLYLRS